MVCIDKFPELLWLLSERTGFSPGLLSGQLCPHATRTVSVFRDVSKAVPERKSFFSESFLALLVGGVSLEAVRDLGRIWDLRIVYDRLLERVEPFTLCAAVLDVSRDV